ncbi:thiamine pyrophosphate-binding protein [Nonomuraea sp. CA-218870]|uniref:thiamine pyrophosphate-binding protein n=1 Tax=Nonomuraea sp. CA-218870 TaxID=3239998 RepID=UPI003D934E88
MLFPPEQRPGRQSPQTSVIPVAEAAGQALAALGVRTVFAAAADDCPLVPALTTHGLNVVDARRPGAATTMAEAHTRTGGQPAVLAVPQGSALISTIPGLVEAARSRTPLLVLAAETCDGLGVARQAALLTAAGTLIEPVTDPAEMASVIAWALHATRVQRRPLVLTFGRQVLAASCPRPPDDLLASLGDLHTPDPPPPDAGTISSLAHLLTTVSRPVFIAGRGALHAGRELEELAERTGALLATSTAAHGLFADDRWNLGVAGDWSAPAVAELVRDADVLIGWGCSMREWTTRRGDLVGSDARVVQVDLNQAVGAQGGIDVSVAGDVAVTARALLCELAEPRTGYRTDEVRRRIIEQGNQHDADYQPVHVEGHIDPWTLAYLLEALLPQERTLVVDRGDFMRYPISLMRVPDAHGFWYSQLIEEAGRALAAGIGAALARPERLAVAVLGYRGVLRAAADLETAVRLGLSLLIVVYNTGDDRPSGSVDLAAVAAGYGCAASVVRQGRDLKAVSDWLAGPRQGPLLIDARIASARPGSASEEA